MTREEIIDIMKKEHDRFNNAQFNEIMPQWLLSNFDKVIMEMPQIHAPYNYTQLKSVLGKVDNPSLLTNYEVGWVCNVLQAVPPYLISSDMEEFLTKKQVIANLAYRYQERFEKEKRRLDAKETQLISDLRKQPKIVTR